MPYGKRFKKILFQVNSKLTQVKTKLIQEDNKGVTFI